MGDRVRDYEHILRLVALFLVGIASFLALRAWLVPADFGELGHFRAGAIADNQRLPHRFAGRDACADCHADVVDARRGARHERIGCEACHGPQAAHAAAPDELKPHRPDTRTTCIRCHDTRAGKPRTFPQVDVADHAPAGPCSDCHQPHHPSIPE